MEPHKWDVLIRVLEDPRTDLSAAFAATDVDSASNYSGPSSVAGGAAAAGGGLGGDM